MKKKIPLLIVSLLTMTLISCKDDDDPNPLGEYIDCDGRAGSYIIKKDGGILSLDVLNKDFKRNYVFEKKSKGIYSNSGGQLTLMYDKAKKHFIIIAQGEGSFTLCKIKDVSETNSSIKTETKPVNTVVRPDDKDTEEGESGNEPTSTKTQDDLSQKDVVTVVVGSKDHTTLVAALKQAELITALSNAGPFTVFAPTNDAFNKLPAGTVDGLMKDEKKADLQDVLQYHITTSALSTDMLQKAQTLGMVNGGNVTVRVKDGEILLNGGVHIVASVRASNGWIHAVDGVLLPPANK